MAGNKIYKSSTPTKSSEIKITNAIDNLNLQLNNTSKDNSYNAGHIERLDPRHTPWYGKKLISEHQERYKFAGIYCKDKIIADLGCGTGYGSKLIANKGAKKIYSFDIDPKVIDYAKKYYQSEKINYRALSADNTRLPNNSVDVVLCFEVIEHLEKPDKLLKEIFRILKPGGTCVLSTPNKKASFLDNPYHIKEFTLPELRKSLNRFTELTFHGQRKLNLKIINFYQLLYRIIPFTNLKFILKLRPWENYKIEKFDNKTNPPYLYLIAVGIK